MLFQILREKQIVVRDSSKYQYFHLSRNISSITLEEIETILWKKMRIFSRTTEKEAAEMCEKISCYYVEHKTNDVSVEDILNKKN
jgi:vesicle coat complex subunit